MKELRRRLILAAALALTAAVGSLLVAGTAHAQTVSTGSLSFSGDSGDYISQGKSYSYWTSKGDALDVSSANGSTVSIRVNAYNGDWWTLDFDAPGTPARPAPGHSAVLVPGTYSAAHRYPFNGNGPGLDLSGEGRGCNTLTGSFTVIKAVFGPQGYVQTFDATFEQHCEEETPAARGEIRISNPPPPAQAAPKQTPPTSRGATTTNPNGTPANTQATPSTLAGGGGGSTASTDTNATTPGAPMVVNKAASGPLVMIGAGIIAWAVISVIGLISVGIVMVVRRP